MLQFLNHLTHSIGYSGNVCLSLSTTDCSMDKAIIVILSHGREDRLGELILGGFGDNCPVWLDRIEIYQDHRENGYATDVLMRLTYVADDLGMELMLTPKQLDLFSMTTDDLIGFYNKFGFVLDDNDDMIRTCS